MKYSKKGFTRVELIVVVLIAVVLSALLLPSISRSREAARRMQCTNNLKQLGLAVHSFSDANRRFPNQGHDELWVKEFLKSGSEEPLDGVDVYSVQTLLLPYLEQIALMNSIVGYCRKASELESYSLDERSIPLPWDDATMNDDAPSPFTMVVPSFVCPSDVNQSLWYKPGQLACCNYGCSRGDSMIGDDWEENRNKRGVFFDGRFGQMTLGDVKDGTSNTLLFAEINTSRFSGHDYEYRTTVAGANIHGQPVSACLAQRGVYGMANNIDDTWPIKGRRWADSRATYTNFHAVVPPNGPSCYDANYGRNERHACFCVTASSNHFGGANVLLVDGSTRFISETIDCGDVNHVLGYPEWEGYGYQWDGASTQGVWGALATPAGREKNVL
ncbi:MAG: DUF1559 domain-containing protein [Thermoguttaceae bacterium]|jgi:type II secretory pathway pseudopilin PulG